MKILVRDLKSAILTNFTNGHNSVRIHAPILMKLLEVSRGPTYSKLEIGLVRPDCLRDVNVLSDIINYEIKTIVVCDILFQLKSYT